MKVTMGRTAFRERQGEVAGSLWSPSLSLVGILLRMSHLHKVARNQKRASLNKMYTMISKHFDVVNEKTDKNTGHRKRGGGAFGINNFQLFCFVLQRT